MLSEAVLIRLIASIFSLNPYCNGTCSRSTAAQAQQALTQAVLILIVMEHALGELLK